MSAWTSVGVERGVCEGGHSLIVNFSCISEFACFLDYDAKLSAALLFMRFFRAMRFKCCV